MNSSMLRRIGLALAAPTAAVLFATIASSIFLVIAGSNPFTAYGDMFESVSYTHLTLPTN